MSLPPEEARSMEAAWGFLMACGRGEYGEGAADPMQPARDILRHFPLGGDLEAAAQKAAPELLGKVEREANQLAQECAREAARADAAEDKLAPETVPDYLNVP
jgi:hypothetical protein